MTDHDLTPSRARIIDPIPDAQHYLGGISRSQLYELIDQKLVTRVNIGRRAFITRESMDRYVDALIQERASDGR